MDGTSRGTQAAFQKGQQVGRYQIVELLAATRFGHSYLGEQREQPNQVSIEGFLPPLSKELKQDFLKGAQALQHLEHPHILHVHDVGIHQDYPFVVTDHLPFRTFDQISVPPNIPPLLVFLPYLKQVASALHYAHRQHVIHGDIRPENILLSDDNAVLLRGFVSGAVVRNRARQSYAGVEALEHEATLYAAPEQIQGNGGVASDQYALGVFIYQLLSGQAPFVGSPLEIAFQKIHSPAPALSQQIPNLISSGVERVVMKALEQQPARRFPDVQAFIDALAQEQDRPFHYLGAGTAVPQAPPRVTLLGGLDEGPLKKAPRKSKKSARSPSPPPRKPPARRSKGQSITRRAFALGFVGLAALGGAGGWYLLQQRFAQAALPDVARSTGPLATQTIVNHQQGLIFTGCLASVNALAWSPDGKFIAAASDDTYVQVFEAATGRRILIYRGHTEEVAAVAWSPDGTLIASAGQDRTVQIWNAADGVPAYTYRGHADRVNSVAWAANGQALSSGSDDKSVRVWRSGNGERLFTFLGHTAGVLCVGWQPNQSSVASGSWDGTLRDWATVQHGNHFNAGDQIFNYRGHGTTEVYALAWSPNGAYIASAGADQTVQISHGGDGTPATPFFTDHRRQDHINRVFALTWSADGASIASGDEDGNVYVWTAANRKTFFRYTGHQGAVNAIAWSPDGKFIASGGADTTVQVWQPQ
jgi:eukaryotic-like serine/threonine-protein kinase